MIKLLTLPEARYCLTHVFCVHCLPEGGLTYPYDRAFGEALCCRCPCDEPRDLRLRIATLSEAQAWLDKTNAAIQAHNEGRTA